MAVGKIVRFDDTRGYGFITPASGGEDVFVHANDFGEDRHLVRPGIGVEYEVEQGERGLKVATVRIVDGAGARSDSGDAARVRATTPVREDDPMCDVLTARELTAEITELLIHQVPALTGGQIAQIRQRLVDHARSHGWVEA